MKWYRRGDNDAEGKDSMSKLESQRFQITEYMNQTNQICYCESELVGDGQTAEEAFNERFRDHSPMHVEHHHENLQKMLQAQAKV